MCTLWWISQFQSGRVFWLSALKFFAFLIKRFILTFSTPMFSSILQNLYACPTPPEVVMRFVLSSFPTSPSFFFRLYCTWWQRSVTVKRIVPFMSSVAKFTAFRSSLQTLFNMRDGQPEVFWFLPRILLLSVQLHHCDRTDTSKGKLFSWGWTVSMAW